MIVQEENCSKHIYSLGFKEWKPLLSLIPEIESATNFGEWYGGAQDKNEEGSFKMPHINELEVVSKFRKATYSIPIIIAFDWEAWNEGREMVSNKNFDFESVDLLTLCKLITALVRNDRFCEGSLVSSFESGLILKILNSIVVNLKNIKNHSR